LAAVLPLVVVAAVVVGDLATAVVAAVEVARKCLMVVAVAAAAVKGKAGWAPQTVKVRTAVMAVSAAACVASGA